MPVIATVKLTPSRTCLLQREVTVLHREAEPTLAPWNLSKVTPGWWGGVALGSVTGRNHAWASRLTAQPSPQLTAGTHCQARECSWRPETTRQTQPSQLCPVSITDHRNHVAVNEDCCFKPLSFGIICYSRHIKGSDSG